MGFGIGGQRAEQRAVLGLRDNMGGLPAGFGCGAPAGLEGVQKVPAQEGIVRLTLRIGDQVPSGFIDLGEAGKRAQRKPGHRFRR